MRDEETVMLEHGNEKVSIDDVVSVLAEGFKVKLPNQDPEYPEGISVPKIRQKRIMDGSSRIGSYLNESIFKGREDAKDERIADEVITLLAYEVAKAEITGHEHTMDYETFKKDKRLVRGKLAQVANATNNEIFRDYSNLKESIMNMEIANPTKKGFADDSAIGQLINYLATEYDEGARDVSEAESITVTNWRKPNVATQLIQKVNKLNGLIKLNLGPHATAQQFFGELQSQVAAATQLYDAQLDKTYKNPTLDKMSKNIDPSQN